jgi:hypothetical protein
MIDPTAFMRLPNKREFHKGKLYPNKFKASVIKDAIKKALQFKKEDPFKNIELPPETQEVKHFRWKAELGRYDTAGFSADSWNFSQADLDYVGWADGR